MKQKAIKISALQKIVNEAVRKRDEVCMVRDGKRSCSGVLTASHYFSVGGNSTWRFYPPNIHCQCLLHHGVHERRQEPFFYTDWMEKYFPEELQFMQDNWGVILRYNQVVRREIKKLALAGDLEGLKDYIEQMIRGQKK
jgi:hypothetical protein